MIGPSGQTDRLPRGLFSVSGGLLALSPLFNSGPGRPIVQKVSSQQRHGEDQIRYIRLLYKDLKQVTLPWRANRLPARVMPKLADVSCSPRELRPCLGRGLAAVISSTTTR